MLMHTIQINAESYTPVDGESVPTGTKDFPTKSPDLIPDFFRGN